MVLMKQFRATSWIDDVKKYRATVTNTLGVMNDFVLKQPVKEGERDNDLRILCAVPVVEETLAAFRERFGKVSEAELIDALRSYCRYDRRRGALGQGEVRLEDANGQQHAFHFETWANKYDVLTIGVYVGPVRSSIVVPPASLRVD